jgi:plastocyanin
MVVPANQLRDVLGIRQVRYVAQQRHLAIVDETLSGESPAAAMAAGEAAARASAPAPATAPAPVRPGAVTITNFAFTPGNIQIAAGDRVSWTNDDDVPHRIQSANSAFAPSAVLDTKASYDVALTRPGEYKYFCSLHPMMTGTIVVR